ncbi:hypothetical protein ACFTWF_39985 [Rhodococcus sp. NPDC056960]|uniref:hypothetical protein n=1 Tax=Rhodococcus sp. NPDC056960 TaxID=3345982 RepID=UPI00362FCD67
MYLFLVTPDPGTPPRHDRADFGTPLTGRLAGSKGLIGDLQDATDGPDGIVYSR